MEKCPPQNWFLSLEKPSKISNHQRRCPKCSSSSPEKQPHKIPASCQFNLMNSSCSKTSFINKFAPGLLSPKISHSMVTSIDLLSFKIACHSVRNRNHRNLRSPVGGRCQDAYLWLDWISIPQIVEDSETSDGDESREISGRLRRRSRGLRMSLRSFRGLDGDVGAEGGRKVKKGRVTK